MEPTPNKTARMDAADESMREKIDVHVDENNSVTLCIKGVNETFTRNEFGALIHRMMQFDFQMGGVE